MRILAISEHYYPRVGGTVEYVSQTCNALAKLGHDVQLLVPGDTTSPQLRPENLSSSISDFQILSIPVGWPTKGDPDRRTRYAFAEACNDYILQSTEESPNKYDLVHNLFGLFINEVLDTRLFEKRKLPCITTVHNVPPQECGRSWPGDSPFRRIKDSLRKKAVDKKNRRRLKSTPFSAWIVPSRPVKELLTRIRPDAKIHVVGHGCSKMLLDSVQVRTTSKPRPGKPLKILTVGGWAPHKCQHLIPEICRQLKQKGINFHWDLIGPTSRVVGYDEAIREQISQLGLSSEISVHGAVPLADLAKYYSEANLYVQPSTEEGFCITALDAAAAGLPIIGSPAGAIPELASLSEGALVPSNATEIALAIKHYKIADLWPKDAIGLSQHVAHRYSWDTAAQELEKIYKSVVASQDQCSFQEGA